ncbi:hypothetical protein N431DRAFT_360521 [Stipitochalara longipes BDJ]|nr:hypothetical protein N431DRAFT_360521 [Stipitochalara longipes BDJ]
MSSNTTKTAITNLLRAYQTALNASSTSSVLPLYTSSGVFMAQHFSTAVGTEAIAAAYDKTFDMITLAVDFDIIEIVEMSEEYAFARTASKGKVQIKGGGESDEANQELFVLKKEGGEWKIERYCFCSTLPPH